MIGINLFGIRHAIVYYHDKYIEPQEYGIYYPASFIEKYTFEKFNYDEVMFNSTYAGIKGL